jgi:hypothetical protein
VQDVAGLDLEAEGVTGVDEKPKGEQCTAVSTQLAPGEPPCELSPGHLGAHYNGYVRWGHRPMGVLPTQADLAAAPRHVGVQPNSPVDRLRRDVDKLIGFIPGGLWTTGAGALSSQRVTAELRERVEQLERAMAQRSDTEAKPDEEPAEWVVNGLRRKVRVQANEINKLTELRRASVTAQPEFIAQREALKDAEARVTAQAQLTGREHRMRLDVVADALHMLRRLNALVGQHDAETFTRAGAGAAMDAVLELRERDTVKIANLEDDLVGASREIGRLDGVLTEKRKRLTALTGELAKQRIELADALSKDAAKINELAARLADAEAAAGWREQCEATHRPECAVWLDRCQRAAGHTGTHSSDARAGKGREWVV